MSNLLKDFTQRFDFFTDYLPWVVHKFNWSRLIYAFITYYTHFHISMT